MPKVSFKIPLSGGKVAIVPVSVLEEYVDDEASCAHSTTTPSPTAAEGDPRPHVEVHESDGGITINIHTGGGGHGHGPELMPDSLRVRPVQAHSLNYDANTGISDWHTEFEFGECFAIDPTSGFMQVFQGVWHNHPLGTEYAELYMG